MSELKLFTIGEAAAAIAQVSRQKPEYVARQLRTFVQRGLLPPVARQGSGPTAAAMLGPVGLAEARVMCWLAETGLTIPTNNNMNVFTAAHLALTCNRVPEGMGPREAKRHFAGKPIPLQAAIDGIREGEHWSLVINVYRTAARGTWVEGRVRRQGDPNAEMPDVPDSYIPEGAFLVNLTPLLLPLVSDRSGMN